MGKKLIPHWRRTRLPGPSKKGEALATIKAYWSRCFWNGDEIIFYLSFSKRLPQYRSTATSSSFVVLPQRVFSEGLAAPGLRPAVRLSLTRWGAGGLWPGGTLAAPTPVSQISLFRTWAGIRWGPFASPAEARWPLAPRGGALVTGGSLLVWPLYTSLSNMVEPELA